MCFSDPAITHSVDRFDTIKTRIDAFELLSDPLYVGCHRRVIYDNIRIVHELLSGFHVSWVFG